MLAFKLFYIAGFNVQDKQLVLTPRSFVSMESALKRTLRDNLPPEGVGDLDVVSDADFVHHVKFTVKEKIVALYWVQLRRKPKRSR